MKRPLIFGERIMYAGADRPVNCVLPVSIRGSLTMEQLQAALQKIQQKHPLLRAGIAEDARGIPHFIVNDAAPPIPVRVVNRQSADDWQLASETEWANPFDMQKGPLARLVWLKGAEVSELLFVCAHCISDGTSLLTLMRELLLLLDEPAAGIGSYPLFSSINELVPPAVLHSKKRIIKTKLLSLLAALIFSLKKMKQPLTGGKDYLLHWKLDEQRSTAIIRSCKEQNSSLHTALCTAFLVAFREVQGDGAKGKAVCPADIRRYVPAIKQDTMFAFAPIIELALDKKEAATGFWEQTRSMKKQLTEKLAKLNAYEMLLLSEQFHPSVNKMVNHLKTTDGSHDITFSNVGRLDLPETYHSFTVETVYSPNVAFPWRNTNTLVVSSFRGRLDFAFLSNEVFLGRETATAIQHKAMDILLAQCGAISPANVPGTVEPAETA